MTHICSTQKLLPEAVLPSRAHPSDIGHDVTLVAVDQVIDSWWVMCAKTPDQIPQLREQKVVLYRTAIATEIPEGFYFELFPRSSISKRGYVVTNSIGLIDPHYRGELKIGLFKYNPFAEDLVLPIKLGQIVFHESPPDLRFEEVEKISMATSRGAGGFGSTGA